MALDLKLETNSTIKIYGDFWLGKFAQLIKDALQ